MRAGCFLVMVAGAACGRLDFDKAQEPSDAAADCGLCPDRSFGEDGTVTLEVGGVANATFAFQGLAVTEDGHIVLVGRGGDSNDTDFLVARLREDGGLDPGFGVGGIVEIDSGLVEDANGVAIDAQGRIVVVGEGEINGIPNQRSAIVARLLPDGTPDPAFGNGVGVVRVDVGSTNAAALNGIHVDAQGRLVTGGQAVYAPNGFNLNAARLLPSGAADLGFDGNGAVDIDINGADEFGALALITPDGKSYIVGQTYAGTTRAFDGVVVRLLQDGSLDLAFGSGGIVEIDFGMGNDRFFTLALDAQSRIVVGGLTAGPDDDDFALARFLPTGAVDVGFGGGLIRLGQAPDENVRALVPLPDGRLVVGGTASVGGEAASALFVLDEVGAIVKTVPIDAGPGPEGIRYAQLDRQGRLLVMGDVAGPGGSDLFVARFLP
ncbi:MAG: hypothetical protein ACKV2T_19875 [Kofleriaceae bacterium]